MVGDFFMEDDDSGQSYFLPHIFSSDIYSVTTGPSVQHKPQWECDAGTLQNVMSCGKMFIHCPLPPHCCTAPAVSKWHLIPPNRKFCCKLIHWTVAKLARDWLPSVLVHLPIHCWSFKCLWALLYVKIYVILHGLMWSLYVPERLFGPHAIKGRLQQQDMIYYI